MEKLINIKIGDLFIVKHLVVIRDNEKIYLLHKDTNGDITPNITFGDIVIIKDKIKKKGRNHIVWSKFNDNSIKYITEWDIFKRAFILKEDDCSDFKGKTKDKSRNTGVLNWAKVREGDVFTVLYDININDIIISKGDKLKVIDKFKGVQIARFQLVYNPDVIISMRWKIVINSLYLSDI